MTIIAHKASNKIILLKLNLGTTFISLEDIDQHNFSFFQNLLYKVQLDRILSRKDPFLYPSSTNPSTPSAPHKSYFNGISEKVYFLNENIWSPRIIWISSIFLQTILVCP